jgi:hypothetical protein
MATPYRLRAHRPTSAAAADGVLGPHERSYYAAATRNVVWAAAPFALLLGYGVWIAQQGLLSHLFNSTFSAFAVAALFVMAIVLITYTSAVGGGELVRVHANGLLDLRLGPRAVRWDEIESLTAAEPEPGRSVERHRVVTQDGTTIALGPSIGGVHDLVEVIRARMAERRLPDFRVRIAEGGAVRFGAFVASGEGLTVGTRVVAWEDLGEVEAEAGEIVVRDAKGQRAGAARVAEVPNAFLLAEMVHERKKR